VNRLVAGVLVVAGVLHLMPGVGVAGGDVLLRLYGVDVGDPSVTLLLRHRALLFGLLGAGFVIAAFRREWRSVALVVALLSTLSFIALALMTPARTPQIDRVVLVDVVLVVLLAVAAAIHVRYRNTS
jgi:hypothetical protein